MRGIELTADDLVRRAVIQALTCHFCLSIESIELSYLVDFRKYFAAEMADLRKLQADGLVELEADWISVTPKGRLLVRAVCMVFDRYLRERQAGASYSKVISGDNNMKDAISILKSEHRSMSVILAAMKELARMVEEQAVKPDFRVFRAMLRYIDEYPERLHHPKEDRFLFARLAACSPEAKRLVDDLRSEHVTGARRIRELERTLLFFEDRWPAGINQFRVAVDEYAAFHWAHMRKEEDKLLPLAQRVLSEADWAAINAAFAENEDPVAGLGEVDFRALFSRIAHLAPAPVGLAEPWS